MPAQGAGPDDSAQVVAIGGDGAAYHTVRTPEGSWSDFAPITDNVGNSVQVADVSIAANRDDSAQILVTGRR
ncbi:hypothetical protein ABTZ03_19840 [Kitasatospora sp. NPDC096077]|uniref:hypothetical protein n=1 Tax=Kitasatospora sp. NPDC096077 TaxID=3155544 RepID=UPI0033183214